MNKKLLCVMTVFLGTISIGATQRELPSKSDHAVVKSAKQKRLAHLIKSQDWLDDVLQQRQEIYELISLMEKSSWCPQNAQVATELLQQIYPKIFICIAKARQQLGCNRVIIAAEHGRPEVQALLEDACRLLNLPEVNTFNPQLIYSVMNALILLDDHAQLIQTVPDELGLPT